MKIHYIYTLLLCAIISACNISCDDDVNDWAIDPNYDAPFRPTGFDRSKLWATSVELSYKGVIDAGKYVFEFSEGDSLIFDNIVRTVEILADTLTVYNDNIAPTKREYRTIFDDLKGTTRYSVRMKAIDKNNRETGYVQLCFDTPTEQVVIDHFNAPTSITLYWDKQKEVTSVKWAEIIADEDTVYQERSLTTTEMSDGIAIVEGLEVGTHYYMLLMRGDQQRGYYSGSTSGIKGGELITVNSTDVINTILTEQVALGVKVITLVFPVLDGEARYEIGQINIPNGIENLYFAGSSTTKELPKLFLHAVRLNGPMQTLNFRNISMDGNRNGSNYFFNIDNAERSFKNVYFESCEISNISRSLVRLSAAGIDVDNIKINDCIIFNVAVGGYGFYNTGNSNMHVGLISITNTTMREIGDQLSDIQGTHDMFVMDHVTFCNYTTGLPKLIRWRNIPGGLQMTNNIFTGTNNDVTLNAIYNATYQMDFTGCYKTNEWTWGDYPFTNITEADMSGEDLFVDPKNGDFHIKEGVRFAGANKVGDPRWWEE
jgi:hypothetical protein